MTFSPPENFYNTNLPGSVQSFGYRNYKKARDAWIAKLTPPENAKVLDIGCGTGEALTEWLGRGNHMTGVDISDAALKEAALKGYETVNCSIEALPFPPASFDCIVALGVLSCATQPDLALSRMYSILKPGGRLFVSLASLGGLRLISRMIVKISGIRNEVLYMPTPAAFQKVVKNTGFKDVRMAISTWPLGHKILFRPSAAMSLVGTWAFIETEK